MDGMKLTQGQAAPGASDFRAITLGPAPDDWAVVGEAGEVVWRGEAIDAARMAAQLASGAATR